jgi:glutamate synthase (NADPH/NADH) large chain
MAISKRSARSATRKTFDTKTLDFTYDVERGAEGMEQMLDGSANAPKRPSRAATTSSSCPTARSAGPHPIPALLATAAVHHHLIRKGLRTSVGLVVESGEPREVHHFCLLAGYGAEAINPYLAFDTLTRHAQARRVPKEVDALRSRLSATSRRSARASSRSCPRWASRPTSPIAARRSSTRSACKTGTGRQVFFGTARQIEGVGLEEIAEETVRRHRGLRRRIRSLQDTLDIGGEYAYRMRGEAMPGRRRRSSLLQHAVRGNAEDATSAFAEMVNDSRSAC